MKTLACLIVSLAVAVCAGTGCTPTPTVQGDIFAGIDSNAPPITTFDGEWLSDLYSYAVKITNRTGVVTLANSTVCKVGDVILAIATVDNQSFHGRHIFSDGSIHEIVGQLVDENTLSLVGGGRTWALRRINTLNHAPLVNAGPDQSVNLADGPVFLTGQVTDDGLPNNTLTTAWSKLSGPGDVNFADANSLDTTATFSQVGAYQVQLQASDGELSSSNSAIIIVH
jgi:hypothetical protein